MKDLAKKVFIVFGALFLTILVIYILFSISIKNLIYDIYNSNGEYSSSHIKDPAIVERINVRNGISDEVEDFSAKEIKENYHIWLLPFINLFNGKIYYTYSYKVYKNDDFIYGSSQVPVTLSIKWENFNWVIVSYSEPY